MPFIDIKAKSLFYTKTSPKSLRDGSLTLIFLHGLGSSNSFYAPIIPGLVEAGHTCIAIDTHGSGCSKYNGTYGGINGIVEDVMAFVSELKLDLEALVFVGHSMGCIVASALAIQLRVRGVVLIGPVHPTESLVSVFNARIATVQKHGMEAMADTIPSAATGTGCTATQRSFIRALILSQTPEGYNSLCRAIADAEAPEYHKAQCGTLIIAGSCDKTSPLASAELIKNTWSRGFETQLEVLDGVGHWHCIEAADQVEAKIEKYLEALL